MTTPIPSAEMVRAALQHLTMKQIDALSEASGIPASTIYKIKLGSTENPGIDTVRGFLPYVPDPTWPHPAGRPCIDVASPLATTPKETGDAA